jgi:hypothetical protein
MVAAPTIPRPSQPFEGGIVIASVWLRDEEPPLVAVLMLLMPGTPHYRVVDVMWTDGRWVVVEATDTTFVNIVPATEHYVQNGGDY